MEKTGVQLVAEGAAAFVADMGRASGAVTGFGSTAQHSVGGISAFQQVAIGALRQIGTIAVDALGQAAEAVGSFLKDSVDVAGDFEAGMNKFQAVAGKGVDTKGLQEFRSLFISLGRELPVSTSEVEQAAIEMVSGGIDPAIVAGGALRQTLQFAAASGMSLADAAATSAKFLAGWTSTSATTAEKVAFLTSSTDDLTRAAAASSTTVAELRLGIFNVQGAAQALHAPFQDVVATLAKLAPAFESSAQAGTALNVFMTRLVPSTSPAAAAMEELGIVTKDNQNLFFDAKGSFLGMANAAQVLKEHLGGLSDEQKISYLHTLFGNDAQKVANLLMQEGAAGIEDMKSKMEDANGVSSTAALMQQGYNVALENAKGSVEALQITLGSFLLPILSDLLNNVIAPGINQLTTLADVLGGNTEAFGQLWPEVQQLAIFLQPIVDGFGSGGLAGGMAAVVSQIDTLIPGFQSVATWLGGALSTALQFVTDHWDAFQGALIAVGAVLAGAAIVGAIASLGATLAALANPITLIVGAVALLGAAWSSNFLGIRDTLTAFWTTTAQPILAQLVTWLSANVPSAIATLSAFWTGTLQPALAAVWSFLQANIFPVLAALVNVYIAAAKAEIGALAAFWTGVLQPALSAVWGFLSSAVLPILGALANVYLALAKKEVEALAGLWSGTLLPALSGVWSFIQANVIPILSDVAGAITGTVGPAVQAFEGWLNDASGGIDGITSAIRDVIRWLNDLASKINSLSLPDWLMPGSPTPWEIGLRGIGSAMQSLTTGPLPRMTAQLQVAHAFAPPMVNAPASATQIYNTAYAGSRSSLIVNVDARGSSMSPDQIKHAVYAGITAYDRGTGLSVDARLRTGVA